MEMVLEQQSVAVDDRALIERVRRGDTIRARHLGRDIVAMLKNLVGGEIEEYTKMMGEAREQALGRMVAEAQSLGANAVVDVRFSTSYLMGAAAEILVYGNAVEVERDG